MRQFFFSASLFSGGALFLASSASVLAQSKAPSREPIIQQIQQLENTSDPKCHATASRLEDFMYGTPLGCEARFRKNQLLKHWITTVWEKSNQLASLEQSKTVSAAQIQAAITLLKHPGVRQVKDSWEVGIHTGVVTISARDKRQYSSIAYALRAILAAKQEQLFSSKKSLKSLSPEAIQILKQQADLYALAVLQRADLQARKRQFSQVNADLLEQCWCDAGLPPLIINKTHGQQRSYILPEIIKQKLASYQSYNQISNQLFIRNIQVYFAKRRWPSEPAEAKALKGFFTNALIQFSFDLYHGSQQCAQQRGESIVRESDVHTTVQNFTPFQVDNFEDVTYFPKLVRRKQTLEAYDLDAFRDSGLHWLYLKHAINESRGQLSSDADPFAAELLAESIAQFGVLLLRVAGEHAIKAQDEQLAVKHINAALQDIQQRINDHSIVKDSPQPEPTITSSPESSVIQAERYFDEVTAQAGVTLEHRSSDWLSRQLRSYLSKGDGVGVSTIPPAFGGSGIAAEDINNDGWPDLLILSGSGNKLYINNRDKTFSDITKQSGIDWKRPDGTYGEPRQPLITDLDNDGWQDIVITYVNDKHRVYRNLGNGTFQDVTQAANLGGEGLIGGPATVFDYDKDGLLDIYIGNFGNYLKGTLPTLARHNTNGLPNKFFRNTGNFHFEDVTTQSGTGNTGWTQAVGHSDFDCDGWQDLIVGNDFGVNAYYRNLGNGTFENVSKQLGTNKASYTMGIGIADLNRDQRPDYYISNIVTMNKDEKYTLPSPDTEAKFDPRKLANMRVVEANDLFLSSTGHTNNLPKFTLSTMVDRGYSSTGWSWDADFFDFDHDGDEDLYVLNGMNDFNIYSEDNPFYADPINNQAMHVQFANGRSEKNIFFSNRNGRLSEDTDKSGLGLLSNSRSATYFDYDNDGDLDLAINHYHGKVQLFENRVGSQSGNWIKIKLTDLTAKANRDAIGATIHVKSATNASQWKELHSTTGYLSVHPKTIHLGVGQSEQVEVQVTWPDGKQSTHLIDTNKCHTLRHN